MSFPIVRKRDFVRAKCDFKTNFVVTREGVPEGIWVSISGLQNMGEEELEKFLMEVFNYIGIHKVDEQPERLG